MAQASRAPTSVVVADDDVRVRTAVSHLLAQEPDFHVVAEAADGAEAVEAANRLRAQLVLVDVRMPGGGPELVRRLVTLPSSPTVVALSAQGDARTWSQMIAAGGSGYLLKGAGTADLPVVLRRCLQGHLVIGVPGAVGAVRRRLAS